MATWRAGRAALIVFPAEVDARRRTCAVDDARTVVDVVGGAAAIHRVAPLVAHLSNREEARIGLCCLWKGYTGCLIKMTPPLCCFATIFITTGTFTAKFYTHIGYIQQGYTCHIDHFLLFDFKVYRVW